MSTAYFLFHGRLNDFLPQDGGRLEVHPIPDGCRRVSGSFPMGAEFSGSQHIPK
jgi:hypothetical protein